MKLQTPTNHRPDRLPFTSPYIQARKGSSSLSRLVM